MNQCSIEECPVCWRSYSSTVIPITISCGHSFCEECSVNLKRCALCRRSAKASTRATNYWLMSLVSKLEQEKKDMVDKQIETDGLTVIRPKTVASRPTDKNMDALMAMKVLLKLVSVHALLGKLMISNSKSNTN